MPYLNLSTIKSLLSFSFVTNSSIPLRSKVSAFSRLHRVDLSHYSYISNNCHLFYVSIGSYVSIAPRVCTIHGIHPYQASSQSPLFHQTRSALFQSKFHSQIFPDPNVQQSIGASCANIVIEDDVWIGSDVKIMSGVRIGRGSVIGSCTFINKDVPPYSIAYGIPMRVVKPRFSDEQISDLERTRWWTLSPKLAAPLLMEIHENYN